MVKCNNDYYILTEIEVRIINTLNDKKPIKLSEKPKFQK